MNWPLVSRRAFDEVQRSRDYFAARVEALTADLLAMRRDGFSVAKPATVREAPDEDANALRAAEHGLVVRRADAHFIKAATKDIMQKTGVSEAQALKEAIALRRFVTDEDPPT